MYRIYFIFLMLPVAISTIATTATSSTDEPVPSNLKDFTATTITKDSINLTWTPPEPRPGPTNYTLVVTDLGSRYYPHSKMDWTNVIHITGYESKHITVTGLRPAWNYNFSLSAQTVKGSSKNITMTLFTNDSVPGVVQNLNVTPGEVAYKQLTASWRCPGVTDRHTLIRGFLINTTLEGWSEVEVTGLKEKESLISYTIVDSQTKSCGIGLCFLNLTDNCDGNETVTIVVRPESRHLIQVLTVGENFNSTGWVNTTYDAPAGRSGKVKNLNVNYLNESDVSVEWGYPTETNGLLLGYGLLVYQDQVCVRSIWSPQSRKGYFKEKCAEGVYKPKETCSKTETRTPEPQKEDRTEVAISGLKPYTSYNITVFAVNCAKDNNGEGEPDNINFVTNMSASGPVRNPSVVALSDSALQVTWYKPAAVNGELRGYGLHVLTNDTKCVQAIKFTNDTTSCNKVEPEANEKRDHCANRTDICRDISSSRQEVNITDLLPDTMYTIIVFAINDAVQNRGEGQKVSRDGTTTIAAPSKITDFTAVFTNNSVILTWSPPVPRPGPTNYTLVITDLGSRYYQDRTMNSTSKTIDIQGYDITSHREKYLRSAWNYSFCLSAHTERGSSQNTSFTISTNDSAAENLVSLTVEEPGTVGQLNITWVPGEETGNTFYNVTWFEESNIGSEQFNYKGGSILSGYTQNKYTIRGLLSYWTYLVSVRPSTAIGLSPAVAYTVARTLDSAPGEVEIFNISQPSDSSTYLQFTVSCPKEKERNGVILFFVFRTFVPANETLGSVSATNGCKQNYTFNAPVHAETNYTLETFANTSKYEGISKTSKFYVAPRAPTLSVDPDFGGSLLKDASDVTLTSAVINICPCLVTDRSQGNITLAGLIVCKGNCETSSDPNYFQSGVMTWKQFRDKGYEGSYRPTPDDWHVMSSRKKRSTFQSRSIRETLNKIEFTLGGDVNCEQMDKSVYCNGPLPPGYTFVVKGFACTAGGCKQADTGIVIITLGEEPVTNLGAIVGGVLGAIAALVILVLIIVFVRRRSRRPTERIQKYVPSIKRLRHSTKLRDFKSRLDLLHRDSNLHFQEEFEELCSSQERQASQFTMRAGNEPVNRFKNWSQEALPYDHSRVVLINSQSSAQDYINASYIAGANSPCEYIATQGPLYSTLSDFWRMVYEHRTGVIVMLCDSVENGKKMVDPYWPDEINVPVRHGELTVTMTGVSVLDVYAMRQIKVTMKDRQDLRVTQLCIRGWSERGCSLPVEKLIDVIRVAGREATKSSGPVTVHCNLGVGRTGMFIALDLLTRFVDNHALNQEVNVYDVVQRMMGCRPNIIQTLTQYMFIHDVLGVIIGKKTQNGSRGATSSVVYQNEGHTINEYNELHEHIRDEHVYSALNEHQMK